jgi:hypothetical protein
MTTDALSSDFTRENAGYRKRSDRTAAHAELVPRRMWSECLVGIFVSHLNHLRRVESAFLVENHRFFFVTTRVFRWTLLRQLIDIGQKVSVQTLRQFAGLGPSSALFAKAQLDPTARAFQNVRAASLSAMAEGVGVSKSSALSRTRF